MGACGDPGIDALGRVDRGAHFCVFYRTKEDMADILVPYFEAGLKNNEYCLCITPETLNADVLKALMAEAIPDFGTYLGRGQIDIIPCTEWYIVDGKFDPGHALSDWVNRLQKAMAMGFRGSRLSGDMSWLENAGWKGLRSFEQKLDDTIAISRMIALCAYPLEKCSAGDILDVSGAHQFALYKCEDAWKVIESRGRRKARKAREEGDIRFMSLVKNSSDIICILDKRGRIIFDSPSAEKILGYPADYLLGMSPLEIIHPDDAGRVRNALAEVFERRNSGIPIEFRIRKADGEYLDLESTGTNLVGVPGVDGVVVITRPITERKRSEEKLRMLSKAVEGSPATIVVTDIKGYIQYVNPKFTHLTGYAFEEVKGKNPRVLKSGHTPPEEYKILWDTILSGKEWHGEFLNKKKGGELYWESAIISPIKDGTGNITHFIAVKEDITERKRMEEELRNAKERAELYVDLMSHDINNINQVAMGYLELARDTLSLGKKEKAFLSRSLEALANTTKLIENVRKLQWAIKGGLKTDTIDLKDVLTGLMDDYRSSGGREVSIRLEARDGCRIRANGLIRDVFDNLVGNAIKHSTDNRGVDINIRLDRSAGKNNGFCIVAVEDNGPGIPDSLKGRLFNRFQRGETKAHGKGLGLYLVRALVDDFHGRVWVEDRVPGDHTRGARFLVKLPAVE